MLRVEDIGGVAVAEAVASGQGERERGCRAARRRRSRGCRRETRRPTSDSVGAGAPRRTIPAARAPRRARPRSRSARRERGRRRARCPSRARSRPRRRAPPAARRGGSSRPPAAKTSADRSRDRPGTRRFDPASLDRDRRSGARRRGGGRSRIVGVGSGAEGAGRATLELADGSAERQLADIAMIDQARAPPGVLRLRLRSPRPLRRGCAWVGADGFDRESGMLESLRKREGEGYQRSERKPTQPTAARQPARRAASRAIDHRPAMAGLVDGRVESNGCRHATASPGVLRGFSTPTSIFRHCNVQRTQQVEGDPRCPTRRRRSSNRGFPRLLRHRRGGGPTAPERGSGQRNRIHV